MPGMAPVMEKLESPAPQTESATSANFTPLPEIFLQNADHAKHRALDAWRRVIHGSKKLKVEPKSNPVQAAPQQAVDAEKKDMSRRAFMGGMAGVALGLLAGRGVAQGASMPTGEPQNAPQEEEITSLNDVHLLTTAEYTSENPSPDFLKGQQSGYVQARETLEDGSKLWSLDWQLKPIDPEDMVYNLPGQRSLGSFRAAVHHLNLGHPDNGRYAKVEDVDRTVTFCNVAASDMADMFQVSHLFSRFDENGTPMLANTMNERIIAEADRKDKKPEVAIITRQEAQKIADMGYPVFLSIKKERKTPKADWLNGHIGLVTPRSMLDKTNSEHQKQGIYLTQAGSESGDAIYFDEREKYTEENGYLQPVFAIDMRDLTDARKNNAANRQMSSGGPRLEAQ